MAPLFFENVGILMKSKCGATDHGCGSQYCIGTKFQGSIILIRYLPVCIFMPRKKKYQHILRKGGKFGKKTSRLGAV